MEQDKIEEYKVQNCFLLRQLLTTLITVLVGGLTGLAFAPDTSAKYILLAIGCFFFVVFTTSLYRTIVELNKYLYTKQKGINK